MFYYILSLGVIFLVDGRRVASNHDSYSSLPDRSSHLVQICPPCAPPNMNKWHPMEVIYTYDHAGRV